MSVLNWVSYQRDTLVHTPTESNVLFGILLDIAWSAKTEHMLTLFICTIIATYDTPQYNCNDVVDMFDGRATVEWTYQKRKKHLVTFVLSSKSFVERHIKYVTRGWWTPCWSSNILVISFAEYRTVANVSGLGKSTTSDCVHSACDTATDKCNFFKIHWRSLLTAVDLHTCHISSCTSLRSNALLTNLWNLPYLCKITYACNCVHMNKVLVTDIHANKCYKHSPLKASLSDFGSIISMSWWNIAIAHYQTVNLKDVFPRERASHS